ncbi:MAG: putative quinol monooxygenase [Chloroflexota bacterium]
MFVRLVRFSLEPGHGAVAQALADDLAPRIGALSGCSGVHVFGDESDGEYGLFVLWESQASADAAAGVIGPQLTAHLEGHVRAAPDIRLFKLLSS